MSNDGHIAFQSLGTQLQSMAEETCKLLGVDLSHFSAERPLQALIQLDAARRRTRQFLPVVLKNPEHDTQSCFSLRLLALAIWLKDDREGTRRVLAPNLKLSQQMLQTREALLHPPGDAGTAAIKVAVRLRFTGDFAGIRAIEGQLCACDREVTHAVPSMEAVSSVKNLKTLNATCLNTISANTRWLRIHTPLPVEAVPRPCDLCSFAHDPDCAEEQLTIFQGELKRLQADTTEKGKEALSKYIRNHKQRHANTGPGPECVPLTSAALLDWVLDLLHVDLNLGKLT
eukprot:5150448-Pleurochrysis_carterae.AAC.1